MNGLKLWFTIEEAEKRKHAQELTSFALLMITSPQILNAYRLSIQFRSTAIDRQALAVRCIFSTSFHTVEMNFNGGHRIIR